jgi:hypothetical protein
MGIILINKRKIDYWILNFIQKFENLLINMVTYPDKQLRNGLIKQFLIISTVSLTPNILIQNIEIAKMIC